MPARPIPRTCTSLVPLVLTAAGAAGQDGGADSPTLAEQLAALERRVAASEAALAERDLALEELKGQLRPGRWYDKIQLRGYTQLRGTSLFGRDDDPDLNVPADRSVSETETYLIRRGRFIFSGDVHPQVFLYAQLDFAGSVGGSGDTGLQSRDLYADLALDPEREHRFRVGQSKVPFGWVNLQSSQNRLALERPDALNSAAEGERDIGVFYYWAPAHIRDLFRKLVRDGLRGSGDYGVFGLGAYSGQGLNRSDRNGEAHLIARFSYPFEWEGELLELGAQAYTGRFVPNVAALSGVTPTFEEEGVLDERYALTAVLYPQPFGIEAEWNFGRGPELSDDRTRIEADDLEGGYVLLNYQTRRGETVWTPFVRYSTFSGGRKFGTNAPASEVEELDLGLEWSPHPNVELTLMYTHTFERTNTRTAPYDTLEGVDRLALQLQFNY